MKIEEFIYNKFSKLSEDDWQYIIGDGVPKGIELIEISIVATGWCNLPRRWMGICQRWIERNKPTHVVWKVIECVI
uniref:Uncharacterized protein n=1 Tax=viral metagenome TaxID=1070528 RepID=A0A6M3X6S3_9ZZZZ